MTAITITIDISGAAFVDRTQEELRDVLAQVTGRCWTPELGDGEPAKLRDSNGNTCGLITSVALPPKDSIEVADEIEQRRKLALPPLSTVDELDLAMRAGLMVAADQAETMVHSSGIDVGMVLMAMAVGTVEELEDEVIEEAAEIIKAHPDAQDGYRELAEAIIQRRSMVPEKIEVREATCPACGGPPDHVQSDCQYGTTKGSPA